MTTTTAYGTWKASTRIHPRVAELHADFALRDSRNRSIGCLVTIENNTAGRYTILDRVTRQVRPRLGFSYCLHGTRDGMTFGACRNANGEFATIEEAQAAAIQAVARSHKAQAKKYTAAPAAPAAPVTEAAPAVVEAAPAAPVAPAAVEAAQAPTSAQLAQMAQIAAPGFMVYDSTDAILGFGRTVDDAVADAGERTEQTLPLAMVEPGTFDSEPGRFYLLPITDSLLQQLLHAPRLDALGFTVIAHGARPLIADVVR